MEGGELLMFHEQRAVLWKRSAALGGMLVCCSQKNNNKACELASLLGYKKAVDFLPHLLHQRTLWVIKKW